MRIKLDFAPFGGYEIVSWFRSVDDFPKYLRHQGNVYEFIMFDKDHSGQNDMIFSFGETSNWVGGYYEIPTFKELFAKNLDNECQCGAKYDRGNPNFHMFYCPKRK